MSLAFVFCIIFVTFTAVNGSSLPSDPHDGFVYNENDLGKALYLTEYIESGDIETAQQLALVKHPEISIKSYAGYFTVNKTFNSNLFFWYFPAKNNPENAPVVLWLQGGPGASSLFGLLTENGPITINKNGKVKNRKYSWHLNHNLIYIDNPVGAGFSFTDVDDGYAKDQIDVSQNLLRALQQFFLLFPKLQANKFVVTGESYAGKYVPAIGYAIHQDNKRKLNDPKKPKINLKGLAIGNGLSDPINQFNYGDYLYQLGLIDTNGRDAFVKIQNEGIECIKSRNFNCAAESFDKLIRGKLHTPLFSNLTGFNMQYNFLKTECDDDTPSNDFLENLKTRRAIHVGNNSYQGLLGKNKVMKHLQFDFMSSVAHWVAELLSYYPILIYNGQLDIIVPYRLTVNYLENLNFSAANEYKTAKRYIWRVDNEIAGYVKKAGNLTEILVRNAGHMVPTDQPKWALDMLERFTFNKGFF